MTGAGGFIGCAVVEALVRRGARVRALAAAPGQTIWGLPSGVSPVFADIEDRETLAGLATGADAAIHLAGPPSVHESFQAPLEYARVHGGGTLALNWQTADPGVHTFHNTAGTNHWNTGPGGPHPNGPGSIATFASALAGDQSIEVDTPVVLG